MTWATSSCDHKTANKTFRPRIFMVDIATITDVQPKWNSVHVPDLYRSSIPALRPPRHIRRPPSVAECIGNLNHLFLRGDIIAEPASMSIVGAISEICGFASVASGGAAVGNLRSVPDRAARSYSERAPPSARLGNGFRLVRLSGIDRIAAPAPSAGRG